jgi:hypothetical protein
VKSLRDDGKIGQLLTQELAAASTQAAKRFEFQR